MQHKEKKFQSLDEFYAYYISKNPNEPATPIEQSIEFLKHHTHHKHIFYQTNSVQLALQIATILTSLQAQAETIAAGIIYSVTHWEHIDDIKSQASAPKKAMLIARNVSKLSTIDTHFCPGDNIENAQADNLRKMILAIVDDPRAVLIKLAEKIVWLSAVKDDQCIDKQQAGEIAMQLYAPLANRLGIGQLKWQLEDLAFRYTQPERYFEISKGLKMRRVEREDFVIHMKKNITDLFDKAGIKKINLTGRAKHIYSIHRKIDRKNVSLNEIYDSTALRILVNSLEDCYEALSIIHTHWTPIEQEFDDYIAKPKPNGYQSIHTAIQVPEKGNVEIQIRTFDMHNSAELGLAAHWKYKEGSTKQDSFEEKIELLRSLLDWQKNKNQALDQHSYHTIFGDRVYVFSPNGEVFSLPTGSTALDFAYLIHTQVGHRCQGAKINGKLSPLTKPLRTGDHVHIVRGKDDKPSRDWLNPQLGYLQTNQAINKVKVYFRKQAYDNNLSIGESIWEKACRRNEIKRNSIDAVVSRFNFKNPKDLLAALGANDITTQAIVNAIKELSTPGSSTPPLSIKKSSPNDSVNTKGFIISGVDNLISKVGKCCRPIPGDRIIGYITQGRGITIHKQTCRNILIAKEQNCSRLIDVEWGTQTEFAVTLKIQASERQGLVNEITNAIIKSKMKLLGLSTFTDPVKNTTYINIDLEVKQIDELQKLTTKLNEINDIISIIRQ